MALNKAGKSCDVLGSDMKIYLPKRKKVLYPDVTVHCEAPEFHDGREDLLLNPLLIVEVLSESTEVYDRGMKFDSYASAASFQEYVLVSQDEMRIETFFLHNAKEQLWKRSVFDAPETEVKLYSANISFRVKDVYKKVFEEKN